MKKLFSLFISFILLEPTIFCQTNYWQQQINYTIDVTLNDTAHTLDGYIKMDYYNNSPDTLNFIWVHVWPNAFKNDRTAFSDQLLENGRTDFYFSNDEKRGYINRLNFKVNGAVAQIQDHPQHQDIIKLLLPQSLSPKSHAKIETPFHVKLPFNFSRGGHIEQAYQITQWYPKPAVYDRKGWHEMPYLDQGEFYGELGNYEVQITLPSNYVVAATGELFSETIEPLTDKNKGFRITTPKLLKHQPFLPKKIKIDKTIASALNTKTFIYKQNNVHDFAWFADKSFITKKDTLQLASGKIIKVAVYYQPKQTNYWQNSVAFIKQSILTRSNYLGEYPYNIVSAVEAEMGFSGGMEYPTITSISPVANEEELEGMLEHEVGHNWNYGILATNERLHPWMDEGINTYYDDRYYNSGSNISKTIIEKKKAGFIESRMPDQTDKFITANLYATKKAQPIETSSEKFNEINYNAIAYFKTSEWMKLLENNLGKTMFDSCMQEYFRRWQFKHPYPEDLKKVIEELSGKNVDAAFELLNKKGKLPENLSNNNRLKKDTKFKTFFSFKDTDKHHYIFAAPAIGVNVYDKLMLGVLIHNYTLPAEKFQFVVAPLYATGSKQLNGIGKADFTTYTKSNIYKIVVGIIGERFSSKQSVDTFGNKIVENFYKIVPSVQLFFKQPPRSNTVSWIDFRTYLISEQQFDKGSYSVIAGGDSAIVYPTATTKNKRYINQLSFNVKNCRALYPYDYQIQLQQGKSFYRLNLTGNYFFNYSKGGGLKVRAFVAKFGYLGNDKISASLYQPKLVSGNGEDDYTYSQYFLGRTASASNPIKPIANQGLPMQQLMVGNTGGLKFRFDQYSYLQGQSQKWVAAINLNTTIPEQILPKIIPLSLFLDIGSYGEAWQKNAPTTKLLYTAGLQITLFKNLLHIYAPLFYSKDFRSLLKTDPEQNKFWKKIFFSIELQNFSLKKMIPQFTF